MWHAANIWVKLVVMSHGSNTQFLTPKVTNMATSVFTYGPKVKPDVATFVLWLFKMEYLKDMTYFLYMSKILFLSH